MGSTYGSLESSLTVCIFLRVKNQTMYLLFTRQNLYSLICSFFSSMWSVTGRSHRSELESMQKKRQHTSWSVGQEDEKTLAGSHAYDMLFNVTTNNYPSLFHSFFPCYCIAINALKKISTISKSLSI